MKGCLRDSRYKRANNLSFEAECEIQAVGRRRTQPKGYCKADSGIPAIRPVVRIVCQVSVINTKAVMFIHVSPNAQPSAKCSEKFL